MGEGAMRRLFELYDLDPLASPEQITERLRERIELAPESERGALREAWEELTLHPRSRVAQAVACFVELEPAPRPPESRAASSFGAPSIELADAVALPELEAMLDAGSPDHRSSTSIDMDPWPKELFE
jgi:hypothetical protein